MSNQVNFRDTKQIVLKKHVKQKRGPERTVSKSITDDFDPETAAIPKTTTHSLSTAMRNARNVKGITQSKLDQALNLPKNTVQNYESGKAVYNPAHINKIARYLGVVLPRPKKTKAKSK
jgi:ribosome-binding protein aMBF1 (putative translation factor)